MTTSDSAILASFGLRYVIYARYSSNRQSPESIQDQIRTCREFAGTHGFQEIRTYEDPMLPGGSIDRRGIQRLMQDAARPSRDFDIVLMQSTSRFSRRLRDTFDLHGDLQALGVRVIAVSQGIDTADEQSDVLIAVHGIVDSVYLKNLASATRYGLEGQVLQGLSAGGRCFGYDALPVENGVKWVINPQEAAIVCQIFEWSAAGESLKSIAGKLNDQKIPPPRKREGRPFANWCPTAIREMLRRELYIGRRIWNKTRYIRRPGTNKRISRPRPRNEWTIVDAPSLQIVPTELWRRVQARQDRVRAKYADHGQKPVSRAFSSPYLLSGFLQCGVCGANMIIVSGGAAGARYGCPQHWNRRACRNNLTIQHRAIEAALFAELQNAVLDPAAIDYLVDQVLKGQKDQQSRQDHHHEIKDIDTQIDHIISAIKAVGHSEELLKSLKALESRKREISIANRDHAHQRTASEIRERVVGAIQNLPDLLTKSPQAAKAKLSEHVDSIRLLPQPDGTYIAEGEWDLLGIRGPDMVAGAGFEPATFGL